MRKYINSRTSNNFAVRFTTHTKTYYRYESFNYIIRDLKVINKVLVDNTGFRKWNANIQTFIEITTLALF